MYADTIRVHKYAEHHTIPSNYCLHIHIKLYKVQKCRGIAEVGGGR